MAAVRAQLVEQVRPVSGPAAHHTDDADPPAVRSADPDRRAGPARGQGTALRRPQPPGLPRPRSRSRRSGRARHFYLRVHLAFPCRDRGVVPFDRLADRDVAGPAVPAHQLPAALDGLLDVEQLADQRLDPAEGSPAKPCASACSAGVYPPLCATACPRHTPATSRRHDLISRSSSRLAGGQVNGKKPAWTLGPGGLSR